MRNEVLMLGFRLLGKKFLPPWDTSDVYHIKSTFWLWENAAEPLTYWTLLETSRTAKPDGSLSGAASL